MAQQYSLLNSEPQQMIIQLLIIIIQTYFDNSIVSLV